MLASSPTRPSLRRSRPPRSRERESEVQQDHRPQPRAAPITTTATMDEYLAPPIPLDAATVAALRTLASLVICTTGLAADQLQETIQTLEKSARKPFEIASVLSERTSMLLVASSGSVKHVVALKKRIPCVDIAWVTEGQCDVDRIGEFPVRSLRGRVVSSTSLSQQSIEMLKKVVTANGGHYRADLNRKCDLLVVPLQGACVTSEKVRFAAANSIRITPIDQLLRRVDRSTLSGTPFSTAPKTTSSEAAAAVAATTSVDASVRLSACVVCVTPNWMLDSKLIHMMNVLGMRRVPLPTPTTTHLVVVGPSFDCVSPELVVSLKVVTSQWIVACYEQKFAVPAGPFRATLPHRPVFTFSGVSVENKVHLRRAIEGLGGCVQDRLILGSNHAMLMTTDDKNAMFTTHLVINPTSVKESEKAKLVASRFAETQREECRVVTPEFIVASALEGTWVDSMKYRVDIAHHLRSKPAPVAPVARPPVPPPPPTFNVPELTLLPRPVLPPTAAASKPTTQIDIDDLLDGLDKSSNSAPGTTSATVVQPAPLQRIPKLSEMKSTLLFAPFRDGGGGQRPSTGASQASQVVEFRHDALWPVDVVPPHEMLPAPVRPVSASVPLLVDSVPMPIADVAPPVAIARGEATLPRTPALGESTLVKIYFPKGVKDEIPDMESMVNSVPNGVVAPSLLEATHFITCRPNKTEAFLSALAAQVWVLTPQFVIQSAAAGRWLSELAFEWTVEQLDAKDRSSATLCNLVLASRRERQVRRRLPFPKWHVALCSADESRAVSFLHVLEAGRVGSAAWVPSPSRNVSAGNACVLPQDGIQLPARTNVLLLDDSVDAQVTLPLLAAAWETLGHRGEPRAIKITYLVHVLCDDGTLPDDSPEVGVSFHPLGPKRRK